jgi:hypothetical protein
MVWKMPEDRQAKQQVKQQAKRQALPHRQVMPQVPLRLMPSKALVWAVGRVMAVTLLPSHPAGKTTALPWAAWLGG